MDKRLAGLLGAAAALTAASGAQAAAPAQSTEVAPAASYRELLDPVPNALAALMADEGQRAKARASGETQLGRTIITTIMAGGGTGTTITTIIIMGGAAGIITITTITTTKVVLRGGQGRPPRPPRQRVYVSRSFAFAARRRWRYVPSNTVSVSDVQV